MECQADLQVKSNNIVVRYCCQSNNVAGGRADSTAIKPDGESDHNFSGGALPAIAGGSTLVGNPTSAVANMLLCNTL